MVVSPQLHTAVWVSSTFGSENEALTVIAVLICIGANGAVIAPTVGGAFTLMVVLPMAVVKSVAFVGVKVTVSGSL